MPTEKEKSLDAILHPVGPNQDINCPKIEWMGEDLTHCPGIGEWKCNLQSERYGDVSNGGGYENIDYKPCNCSNYEKCEFYKAFKKLE